MVYVCRNPKDVAVSYCHHSGALKDIYRMREGVTFAKHSELLFKTGRGCYGDYWAHLKVSEKRILPKYNAPEISNILRVHGD